MEIAFLAAVLALPFAAFAALTLWRKARYRALAEELGARHRSTGLFSPGAIVGSDFEIAVVRAGKTYRTELQVAAGDIQGRFALRRRFFEGGPDWDCAWVPAPRTERVFMWEVTIGGHARADREQQAELLRCLPRASEFAGIHAQLEAARIQTMFIADGKLTTSFGGVVSSAERLGGAIDVLRRMLSARTAQGNRSTHAA